MNTACLIYTVTYTFVIWEKVGTCRHAYLPSFIGCSEDSLFLKERYDELATLSGELGYLASYQATWLVRASSFSYLLKLKKEYFLLGTYLVIEFKFQVKMNYSISFKFFNNVDEKNSKTVTG